MTECKYCHTPITWTKRGGKNVPLNIDGTDHHCKDGKNIPSTEKVPTQIGKLVMYEGNQAKLLLKDGKEHSYAISAGVLKEWQSAGHLLPPENHPDVWLDFSVDDKGFIRPSAKVTQRPEWAKDLTDPTKGEVKSPFKTGTEVKQEKAIDAPGSPGPTNPQQVPGTAPQTTPAPAQSHDLESVVRSSIQDLMPSDRVGYRISLAGMINSVIEMEKMSTDAPKTYAELEADVKKKALALFFWCDSMTTQNIKGVK